MSIHSQNLIKKKKKTTYSPRITFYPCDLRLAGTTGKSFVPVTCPVLPGTVFYGVVPAPPPPSSAAIAAAAAASVTFKPADPGIGQLCAKLVSSADDLTAGSPGTVDYMRYTISTCVNQDPTKNLPSPLPARMIFEGQSYYIVLF